MCCNIEARGLGAREECKGGEERIGWIEKGGWGGESERKIGRAEGQEGGRDGGREGKRREGGKEGGRNKGRRERMIEVARELFLSLTLQ